MDIIPKQTVKDLGIAATEAEVDSLVVTLNEELNQRIGVEIANQLDDAQLKQMVTLSEAEDKIPLQSFLESNVEDLEQIVKDQVDSMLGELLENKEKLSQV
jgi:hypothetical protein